MAKRKRTIFRHYFGQWNLLGPRYFLPTRTEEIARAAAEKRRQKGDSLQARKRPRNPLLVVDENSNIQDQNILTDAQRAAREAFLLFDA
jgi:hypothetical protein